MCCGSVTTPGRQWSNSWHSSQRRSFGAGGSWPLVIWERISSTALRVVDRSVGVNSIRRLLRDAPYQTNPSRDGQVEHVFEADRLGA